MPLYAACNEDNSEKNIVFLESIEKITQRSLDNKFFRIAITSNMCKKLIYCSYKSLKPFIIMSDKYYLYDIRILKKFNFKITEDYINNCDNVEILSYLKATNKILKCPEYALFKATARNNINVLEWWKNSGFPLKYTSKLFDTLYCNTDMLDWWKNSGLELEYSEDVLDYASRYGYIDILDWWLNSGLELKYSEYALNNASNYDHIDVLEWWFNSGLPLKYDARALDLASSNGHVDVLEWWKNSGLKLKYTKDSMIWASDNGHINVLEWWKKSGLPLQYSKLHYSVPFYYVNINEDVLKWWDNSGLLD
jgi:ankyrin repeat protein